MKNLAIVRSYAGRAFGPGGGGRPASWLTGATGV